MAASTFDVNTARGLSLIGYWRAIIVKITGPNPYATGGEAIAAGPFKMGTVEFWTPAVLRNAGGTLAVVAAYDYTNNKLQYFQVDPTQAAVRPLDEVANATDLSGFSGRTLVLGK